MAGSDDGDVERRLDSQQRRLFGSLLADLRVQQGLTVRGGARLLGMDPGPLARVEAGEEPQGGLTIRQALSLVARYRPPPTETRSRIMALLDLDEELLPGPPWGLVLEPIGPTRIVRPVERDEPLDAKRRRGFGAMLASIRVQQRLTIDGAARGLGMSSDQLARVEAGSEGLLTIRQALSLVARYRPPPTETRSRIMALLDLDEELLPGRPWGLGGEWHERPPPVRSRPAPVATHRPERTSTRLPPPIRKWQPTPLRPRRWAAFLDGVSMTMGLAPRRTGRLVPTLVMADDPRGPGGVD